MEFGSVGEQLAADLISGIGPLDMTRQVFALFFISLHVRQCAKYVIFVILVLDPQVNRLPI